MVRGRVIDLPPDPLAIARAMVAAGLRDVALLHASAGDAPLGLGRWSFVAAEADATSSALDPAAHDARAPELGAFGFVPRWIGVIPYDGQRGRLERSAWLPVDHRPPPLLVAPSWRRYPAIVCVDHREGRVLVVGEGTAAVERLARMLLGGRTQATEPELRVEAAEEEPATRHAERIAAARELIHRGDLYQVNLARRLTVRVQRGDALGLYARLAARAPTPFGCFLALDERQGPSVAVASSSPELLLHARAGRLFTAPIKGTRPRGRDAAEDVGLARELDADPKERAELTMIVDVERNDLGRVAEVGSVRVVDGPRVVTHRTVHHRVALLAARPRAEVSRAEVLSAMVPSGSVTGAPKVRAMEVIAALEPARRGLYTGAIGFIAHDGSVTLAMAIRTAVLRGDEGEYWTGGGIVADSDPSREVEETRWKAVQILQA